MISEMTCRPTRGTRGSFGVGAVCHRGATYGTHGMTAARFLKSSAGDLSIVAFLDPPDA